MKTEYMMAIVGALLIIVPVAIVCATYDRPPPLLPLVIAGIGGGFGVAGLFSPERKDDGGVSK
jgi:NhaP-type Na+/H+ or K+/H+ antiporter